MTDRVTSPDKKIDVERQPGHPVAADEDVTEPFTVSDLLAYHEAHPQPRKYIFRNFLDFFR